MTPPAIAAALGSAAPAPAPAAAAPPAAPAAPAAAAPPAAPAAGAPPAAPAPQAHGNFYGDMGETDRAFASSVKNDLAALREGAKRKAGDPAPDAAAKPGEAAKPDAKAGDTTPDQPANFAALRAKLETTEKEKIDLQTKIAGFETEKKALLDKLSAGQVVNPADYEALKKKHDTISARLEAIDLQNHPEFESKYMAPIKSAAESIARIIKANEGDPAAFAAILQLPRSKDRRDKMEAVMATLDVADRGEVINLISAIERGNQAASAAIAKAAETKTALDAQARTKAQGQNQESVAQRDSAIQAAIANPANWHLQEARLVDDKGNALAGDALAAAQKHNEAVKANRAALVHNMTVEADWAKLTDNASKAIAHDFWMNTAQQVANQYVAIKKELDAIKAAKPGVGSGDAGAGGAAKPEDDGKGFDRAVTGELATLIRKR